MVAGDAIEIVHFIGGG
ncbi:hypothetical protein JYK14_13140 [Siccirubricoccus sp. KC 17139]|uniref:Uncharacterized protein n=1 Tax=Siccirubricoccus soli TaxID=2899147 RepID=A0ABT1D5A2_9PROT|nr:hypothetical protein [Siccirubricoccus soli]MCP2683234.1 hypothetical protein [Siccirubricoccus soli]